MYTGLLVELGHLKIETRLIDERFVNVIIKLFYHFSPNLSNSAHVRIKI